ncbi:hypothetical protein D9M68_764330 [compost metagenome]
MVFLVILIASFLLQLFLPWWVIVVLAFSTCGLIGKTAKISFWQPLIAILLLWVGMALYKSIPNHHMLANRVAEMTGVKLWYVVLILTGILGGLVAGISGLCGYYFRKAVIATKNKG